MRVLITEFMAIVAIGDGIVGLLFPVRHTSRLAGQGPEPWRRAMRVLTKHPGLTRALGVVETAGGLAWVARQSSKVR